MPWDRADVSAFVKLSETALRRVERKTEPVPSVPLPGRGTEPIIRYDEDEVRGWWAARVAEARAARTAPEVTRDAAPQARRATARPRRVGHGLRLPFAVDEAPRGAVPPSPATPS